ncbi:acyl-CoA synthetase [Litoribrevibacter euphylliae]|uniref:Acyl-CoA synthetase n=1 Tax=Litoribrevibacter euphylliae TaxID=1834034 RepID=A0ABV7HD47_9GAMM
MLEVKTQDDVKHIEASNAVQGLMPFDNTYDAIKASAKENADKAAISFFLKGDEFQKAHHISYQTLLERITQTANFFHSLGLTENDVVAFLLPNLPETHYVLWGGEAVCKVFAVNPLLEPEQIKDLLSSANAKVVVTMNPMTKIDLWPKVQSILNELPSVKHVVGIDIYPYVKGPAKLVAKAMQLLHRKDISIPHGKAYYNFSEEIQKCEGQALQFYRRFSDDTISSLFCTGGTTGLPKIAQRTHRNELANAVSVRLMASTALNKDKSILAGLPLFHVNGALITGLLPFSIGATVVMATPQGFRGENLFPNFWSIIEHFKVGTFSGVPTVYSALMNFSFEGKDISSLEFCLCGAAPMPVETFKAFEQTTGVKIIEGYGLTEATCVSSVNPIHGKQKVGSIGVRIPHQQMMCVKHEGDRILRQCSVNEIGTLVVRGPNVFSGYLLDHQNEGLWMTDEQGQVWMNTGDLARQDDDGYFWLTGRKKELIVRGGHNIEPKMIEEAMCKHPAINLAAAVGKPDLHAGEVPVCYVQVKQGYPIEISELIEFADRVIPERAAIPKDIHVVSDLPVTAVGKVFKPALEMQEIEKCVIEVASKIIPTHELKVEVRQDPLHGLLAHIAVTGNLPSLDELSKRLGGYTFKTEIVSV